MKKTDNTNKNKANVKSISKFEKLQIKQQEQKQVTGGMIGIEDWVIA